MQIGQKPGGVCTLTKGFVELFIWNVYIKIDGIYSSYE